MRCVKPRLFGGRPGAWAAEGFDGLLDRLLVPNQVHGDHVAVVRDSDPTSLASVRTEIAAGAMRSSAWPPVRR